jgi:hypothetical protein
MWKQISLFRDRCVQCPRKKWCARTPRQQCLVPDGDLELARYWAEHRTRLKRIGGIDPQALPAVTRQPQLPSIIHVHPDQGFALEADMRGMTLGVYSKRAVSLSRTGCPLHDQYLRSRGLSDVRKFLLIGGEDRWLQRFSRGIGEEFFKSVASGNVCAVLSPNYSAFDHVEHWVWLDNRAIGQTFMRRLLERRLPGIFHTYLEDSSEHLQWLTEYLRLNPTQQFLATGFDRGGANDERFVARRLEMLAEVENSIGRPLHFVFCNLLTRLGWVRRLVDLFPGRVHLVGQSVFLRSVKGSVLQILPDGKLIWKERAREHARGLELFRHNAAILEQAIRNRHPAFFSSGTVKRPHFLARCAAESG